MAAIKEYEQNKWKVIGQKVGKPAKVCPENTTHTSGYISVHALTDPRLASSMRRSILGARCKTQRHSWLALVLAFDLEIPPIQSTGIGHQYVGSWSFDVKNEASA